jgi:hypothetical protein
MKHNRGALVTINKRTSANEAKSGQHLRSNVKNRTFLGGSFLGFLFLGISIFISMLLVSCSSASNKSDLTTECTIGFNEVLRDDLPSTIAGTTSGSTNTVFTFFKTARLDGVCLDPMTQYYNRYIDMTIEGMVPVVSAGYINSIIFPGNRLLQVPGLNDVGCKTVADESIINRQVSAFSCQTFYYFRSNIGNVPLVYKDISQDQKTIVTANSFELPWTDVNIKSEQYIYVIVTMPAGYIQSQVPSQMSMRFRTIPIDP